MISSVGLTRPGPRPPCEHRLRCRADETTAVFSPLDAAGGEMPLSMNREQVVTKDRAMRPHWFVRGDIDGFFGLFIDNLLQLMLVAVLCGVVCGFPPELITGRVLPGAAVSILLGNLFYAWQARALMRKAGREDVTALPFGIN